MVAASTRLIYAESLRPGDLMYTVDCLPVQVVGVRLRPRGVAVVVRSVYGDPDLPEGETASLCFAARRLVEVL